MAVGISDAAPQALRRVGELILFHNTIVPHTADGDNLKKGRKRKEKSDSIFHPSSFLLFPFVPLFDTVPPEVSTTFSSWPH